MKSARNPKAQRGPAPKSRGGGRQPGAGRPRKPVGSAYTDLERTRELARRHASRAMQGFVDQLKAMKTEFYQGVPVAECIDWSTRQNAQREILDRAGLAKVIDVNVNNPFNTFLLDVAEKLKPPSE